jgi:hypothetical protein
MNPADFMKAIYKGAAIGAVGGALLLWGGIYIYGRLYPSVPQTPPPRPQIFALDADKLKTNQDVVAALKALSIKLQMDMSRPSPELESFKAAQKFFKPLGN